MLIALAVLAIAPAAAPAAPDPAFELAVPGSCAAGECRPTVTYRTDALLSPVLLAVDWENDGVPEDAFSALSGATCLPGAPCAVTGPAYATAGTYTVAVRVTGIDQVPSFSVQTVRVAAARAENVARDLKTGRAPDPSSPAPSIDLCAPVRSGEQCGAGNGRRTAGGGELVSHAGWPAVSGILWKVLDSGSHSKTGGPANDELLGHHGSDKINGAGGNDILWGDWDPRNNNTRQRDVLNGGAGADWIYPSHGATVVRAGPGADHVKAFYGHGSIDCGPGRDTAQVRMNGAYTLHGCEHIVHFCQFGSTPDGTCKQPGGHTRSARLRG